MDWLWPGFLLLLGLVPAVLAAYLWMLRRRRRFAVRYSSLSLVRAALPETSWLRRHLPFGLFLAALGTLALALARPVATVTVPAGQTTVILAIDVSRSMCSTDIAPNRLVAAQAAALSFVQRQSPNTQIGIVAFAGFAQLVQAPTTDQADLETAIRNLSTARRTAIGSGIVKSLEAIAEVHGEFDPGEMAGAPALPETSVPAGEYAPDIIVLLTDGVSNSGPLPLEAAQEAVQRGIRVYTIGFGTENGSQSSMVCRSANGGEDYFGGSPFGGTGFGGGYRRGIDEATLQEIAAVTGGTYYAATSASELHDVFQNLPTTVITRRETTEVTFVFAALGAMLAALAMALAWLWHSLP